MNRAWQTRVVALVTIGGLTAWAIYLGYNHLTLALALAAMAGIAGYEIGTEQVNRALQSATTVTINEDTRP